MSDDVENRTRRSGHRTHGAPANIQMLSTTLPSIAAAGDVGLWLALHHHDGDVIGLLLRAKLEGGLNNTRYQSLGGLSPARFHYGLQPQIAEFVPFVAARLRDSVRDDDQRIAGSELHLRFLPLPFREHPQYCGSGVQAIDPPITPKQEGRRMSAVDIPQAAAVVVVPAEKERCIA